MAPGLDRMEKRELRQKACRATLDALHELGGEGRRDAISERALAHGGFTARELAAPPPSGTEKKYGRLVDHNLSWALTNLKGTGAVENPGRGVWTLANTAATAAPPRVDERVSARRLYQLRTMPYPLYLRTPEWRRTRAAALVRAGDCCSLDATHTDDLEVHHRTYERLGSEQASDLVVLCHPCHQLHHGMFGRPGAGQYAATSPDHMNAGTPVMVAATASPVQRRRRSWLARLLAG